MHWNINKYVPVTLPDGYLSVAFDPEKGSLQPVTDNADHIDRALHQLLSRSGHEPSGFRLKKYKTGKPYGILGGRKVGVSISHCRSLLVCSLYIDGETGIDVEPCDRTLHPRLRQRICHPEELDEIPDEYCGIRLWTIKEAVLKYMGTGLRLAMNKIKLEMVDEHLFRAEQESETVLIASFVFRKHWIALAFRSQALE